ncbi:MAG: PAS domain S-box protein [Nitrospinota bacterium]|nr:PAS domain S-box protein [Nitrospinota bacterium]
MRNIVEKERVDSHSIFFLCDLDLKITFASSSLQSIMGYTASQAPKTLPEIMNPSEPNVKALEKAIDHVKAGRATTARLDVLAANGNALPMKFEFNPISCIDKGPALEAHAHVVPGSGAGDEKAELFARAMDHCSVSMVMTDEGGAITYANNKFLDVTGYRLDDLLGKTPGILKSGFTPPEVHKELWKTIKNGEEWKGEFLNKRKNGDMYWERAFISPIIDEEGRPKGFLGVKEDITENKEASLRLDSAQRSLRRANRALRALNAVNHELIEASSEFSFLSKICNIMVQIGGYKMAWIGLKMNDEKKTVDPVAHAGFASDYLKGITVTWADEPSGRGPTGTSIRTLAPVVNRDTTSDTGIAPWREAALKQGFASSGAFPIIVEEVSWGALMVYSRERDAFDQEEIDLLRDLALDAGLGISLIREKEARRRMEEEQRILEERMRQAQKAESMGLLASGVAHDFNNLLATIMLNLDLARLESTMSGEARDHIDEAMRAARRSAEICRQMLAYTGKGSAAQKKVDPNQVIGEMARLLQVSFSKKVELSMDLSPSLPPALLDVAGFQQVVMNLISNAAEALGEEGGRVTIRTWKAECAMELDGIYCESPDMPEGPCLVFEVADNGPGMKEETIQKIFDPFYTTKPTGRGLGLAVVLGIVRAHGGAVAVQSVPGKGATISAMFPMGDVSAVEPDGQAQEKISKQSRGAILVIEDEEYLRGACRIALDMSGYKVFTASNGKEGLEVFSRNSEEIKLVLLDLSMPVMDGRETLKKLSMRQKKVSVILTSGFDKSMEDIFPENGAISHFLPKPYNAQQLISAVREVIDSGGEDS